MTKKDVINDFTKIKGVGKAKAEALYNNGFDSLDKLKKAKITDLKKIDGITDEIAKNIVNEFKEKTTTKNTKVKAKKKEKEEKPKPEKPEKKVKPKAKEEKPEKEEKEPEAEEEKEEQVYKVKKKPELSKETKEKLAKRKKIKKHTPEFLREEWFRYKRISKNWRRPDGISSKMRRNFKYRPSKVRVGFRGPSEVRNLHSSGFEEVLVFNASDLEQINPKTQAARIGSSVGTKKRIVIEKKAEEMDIRILNI